MLICSAISLCAMAGQQSKATETGDQFMFGKKSFDEFR